MAIERDCNNCGFHSQDSVSPWCRSCLMSPVGLPGWKPELNSYLTAIGERHPLDVASDPEGILIRKPGEVLYAYKEPTQSRKESLVETTLNVFSGWLISLLLWMYVIAPAFGIESTLGESAVLNGIFTVISIVRGYFWRRFFANKLWRKA